MTPDTDKERSEFEAWYFAETDSRLFCESQWRAWQARAAKAPAAPDWWRKRADEIELQVAQTGSPEAMRCYTDMRTLLQAAAPPAPTEQWRDIETAPKTRKARLVWCPEYRNIYEVTWCEHKIAWIHFGHGDVMTDTATHWRDLPAPPQGAAKGAT